MNKTYISAEQLERHSWEFAVQLHEAGHRFDWIAGVARGGAQISIYMQEALRLLQDRPVDYAVIQAWSYTGIGRADHAVGIRNLGEFADAVQPGQSILVVDDVFDRGTTLKAIGETLATALADKGADVFLSALYYKPENNCTDITPHHHYRTYAGSDWLVFPHELCGLSRDELAAKGFPVEKLPDPGASRRRP